MKKLLSAAAVLVFAGSTAMAHPGHHHHTTHHSTHSASKAVYTCVMHPQIHKSAPGKCPICGMKLVKK